MFTRNVTALLAFILASTLATGCSSGGGRIAEGQKTIEGFQATKSNLAQGHAQVDRTLAAMDRVNAGGDLEKSFKDYTTAVADLEKAGESARKRSAAMKQNVAAYVQKWQEEMGSIDNPLIKASLEKRREAVRANFAEVRAAAEEARRAYDPFLRDQKEIQRALSIDLSPGALPGLKPAFDRARGDGESLKGKIAAVQKELDDMEAGLTATGRTASAR